MWDLLLVLNSGFKCHCAQVSRPDFQLFLCKTGSFQLNKTLFQMDATVPPAPDSLVFYSWLIPYRLWRRKQTNHLLSSEYPFNSTYFLIYLHAIKTSKMRFTNNRLTKCDVESVTYGLTAIMLLEILLKTCDMNKCDPFIVHVWLVEILLKKVRHE